MEPSIAAGGAAGPADVAGGGAAEELAAGAGATGADDVGAGALADAAAPSDAPGAAGWAPTSQAESSTSTMAAVAVIERMGVPLGRTDLTVPSARRLLEAGKP